MTLLLNLLSSPGPTGCDMMALIMPGGWVLWVPVDMTALVNALTGVCP